MVQSMMANGMKILNMAMELRHGQMEQFTMDSIKMVKSMVRVSSHGPMVVILRVIFWIIKSKEKVFIHGLMVESLLALG